MSNWTTDSAANRTKKSYFNGFIDMSGGELTVRHRGATFGGDVSFGAGVDISGDISTRGDVDIGGTLTVTEDLSAHELVAAQRLTVSSDASFADVNIGGNLFVKGSITSGDGTLTLQGLTLTGDLSAHALISTKNLNVVSDASFGNNVNITGRLDVVGDVSAESGTITGNLDVTSDLSVNNVISTKTLKTSSDASFGNNVNITGHLDVRDISAESGIITGNLDVTSDLSVNNVISTKTLKTSSDASFGNNVNINGRLDVVGNVSAGAGAFTGDATAYRSINSATGVYMGEFENNALMNFVSEGASAEILFSSYATGVTTTGNIIYHNESESDANKKSSFRITPHYANPDMGLQIQSLADLALEVSIDEGMLTIKRGLDSSVRNYASYWATAGGNAVLKMGTYPYADGLTNAYFHIVGPDGHDLLLTGHGYSGTNDSTRGFNLYSKQASYAENSASHDSQGLCIQTSYDDGTGWNYDFRLGIGDRPKAYQFLTTKDAKIGGTLDVDGSLNVTNDASFAGDLIVHGAGRFTGSTNINSTISPAGVYLGNITDENNSDIQNSIIQMTSTGTGSVIDFTSSAASGDENKDFEGRILYQNSTHNDASCRLYLVPKYSYPYVGLRLDPASNGAVLATVEGDLHVKRDIQFDGSLNLNGTATMKSTLAIVEAGAGTDASATGGSITLSHATSNGTGKNSIVFKSASNPNNDFGYIQYEDDGGIDSTSLENGLLTIGIQNDPTRYSGTTTGHAERIKFDIAGASAYLQARANSTGGNIGAAFTTNYVNHVGLSADAYTLDTIWGTTLTAYNSTDNTERSALYQYFENAEHSDHDLAFTGMNAPGGSTVDGSSKPYGYMLRSRSDGYIAYQTGWIDGGYDGYRLALGVNALPGRYYDFAVGGKSHLGNDVDISGDLTVSNGAGVFTGAAQQYDTANTVGVYIGKNSNESGYATAQFVTGEENSWLGFTHTGSSNGHEGLITHYNSTSGTKPYQMEFHPNRSVGDTTALRLKYVSSGVLTATVEGDIRSTRNLDVSGSAVVDGNLSVNGTIYGTVHGINTSSASNLVTGGAFGVVNQLGSYSISASNYGQHNAGMYAQVTGDTGVCILNLVKGGYTKYVNDTTGGCAIKFWQGDTVNRDDDTVGTVPIIEMYSQYNHGNDHGDDSTSDFFSKLIFRAKYASSANYTEAIASIEYFNNNVSNYRRISSYAYVSYSDARIKKNVVPIEGALDKICALQGVTYHMKEQDDNSVKAMGLIAQDVLPYFPEAVSLSKDASEETDDKSLYSINYATMVSPLIECVKELKTKNDALEAENTLLKSQMQDVLARLTALENK